MAEGFVSFVQADIEQAALLTAQAMFTSPIKSP
jgi:hypothetical protein